AIIIPSYHPFVISINGRPAAMGVIVSIGLTYLYIGTPCVVDIRRVIRISYGRIVSSIRCIIHDAMAINGSGKIVVIGLVYIISVVYVDESRMITVISPWVIVHIHPSNTIYPTIVITNIDVPDSGYPSVIIVIDRNVFHLYYGTVVIILDVRI